MALPQRRGLHQLAVEQLGKSIVSGELPAGAQLDPVELESEFGVSRSVVRDALRVLVEKGLVEARPKRGTTVRSRSDWNLIDADVLRWQFEERADDAFFSDLAEVRAILEPAGARLAAERRTEHDLDMLRSAIAAMSSADVRGPDTVNADVQFHRALLLASQNELLQRMELIIETGLRARNVVVHQRVKQKDWTKVVEEHAAVLRAVEAQDADAAEESMRLLVNTAHADALAAVAARAKDRKRRS